MDTKSASNPAIPSTPIRPEEFHTALSVEYDIVLVKGNCDVYRVPGVRCDDCQTINNMVYTPTRETLLAPMDVGGSISAAVGDDFDDGPLKGALVCLDCGCGCGADLTNEDVRTVTMDAYQEYVEFRQEAGEPL